VGSQSLAVVAFLVIGVLPVAATIAALMRDQSRTFDRRWRIRLGAAVQLYRS
jgi:hypothetical protein